MGSLHRVPTLRTRQAGAEQSVSDIKTRWIARCFRSESRISLRKEFESKVLPELKCTNGCDPHVITLPWRCVYSCKRRVFLCGGHLRCANEKGGNMPRAGQENSKHVELLQDLEAHGYTASLHRNPRFACRASGAICRPVLMGSIHFSHAISEKHSGGTDFPKEALPASPAPSISKG